MQKHLYLIFTTLFFPSFLLAQSLPEPCDLQVQISVGICIDPPGCWTFLAEATGGEEPYTYEWENGVMGNQNVYWNPSNPYQGTCEIVTVTDANGCIAIAGRVHSFQTPPNFGLTPDTIIVEGIPPNFDVSTNDTLQGINYELVQSSSYGDLTFDVNGQGTYTPDANYCGLDYFTYLVYNDICDYSEIVTVTVFNGPCAKVFVTSSDCNNTCNGSAFFYHQGTFTAPLTYLWSNGGIDESTSGLCMGNASLTVTDNMGTSEIYQFLIEEATLDVSIDAIDVACQSSRILLTPLYSQAPSGDLDFIWNGPTIYNNIQFDTTQFIFPGHPDSTNIFQVILNSSNGCTDTAFHTINVLERPRIVQILDEDMFCAFDTVELTAIVEKGTPPYSYQWLGPQGIYSDEPNFSFPNATSAHTGSYKLYLSDVNGCLTSKTKNISVPDGLDFQVSANGTNDLLCQGSDLRLYFGVTSGSWTAPYSVEWTGPNGYFSTEVQPILEDIQLDMAGFYVVKVFYEENCFLIDSTEVMVSNESAEVIDLQITPPTGCWTDDGQIQVMMSFPPPYSVSNSWTGQTQTYNDNPFVFNQADDGDFWRLEISTGNCIVHVPVDVPKPDIPSITTTDLTCIGNDGTATVTSPNAPQVSARFQLPNAAWGDYVEGLFVENLIGATYNVYIRDSVTNCTFNEQITINPYLDFDINVVDFPSCDLPNGSLEVSSTGQATPPVSFDWNNNFSGSLNTGLETGWHSVTMTDGDGCQRHENIFLSADQPCNSLISGHAYFNFDCDCVVDGEEMPLANMRICAESSNFSDCFYTDNNGAFWLLPIFEGDYTLTAYPNNDFIQESCSPPTITISNSPTNINNADFFFCGDTITDLSVDAYCAVARPGFTQDYIFQVNHEGTSFTDSLIDLSVDLDDNLDVFQITPTPDFQNLTTNKFTWNNYRIEFNSEEEFKIKATVNAMLDDVLITTAQITSNNEDVNLDNNSTFCEQIVVGSYDPNDKLVNPLGSGDNGQISLADSMFNYTIRFQNTGTDTAFTVVVRDTLDSNVFELNSVQTRMSSHPFQLDVEGENILVFSFENINLPDSSQSLAGSQGFVTFDIALKPNLPFGTYIQNKAAIYFDFNEPIITNTASNFLTSQKVVFQNQATLKVYPSPMLKTTFAQINLTQPVQYAVLELYTIEGKLVQTILPSTSILAGEITVPFDTSNISSGIYFITLKTDKGNAVVKLVKVRE